jgi:hypothetical protein
MKLIQPLVLLLTGSASVAAGEIPIPLPRPIDFAPKATVEAIAAPLTAPSAESRRVDNSATSLSPSDCQLRLAVEGGIAQPLPGIFGPGECHAEDVVRLEAVRLPNNQRVIMTPAATLRCTTAEAVVQWVRQDVAPTAAKFGSVLKSIENYDSYDCRGRNNVVGATLSEHGRANALDVRALKLASGTVEVLTDTSASVEFRLALRRSACARFTTVLGPGADNHHENHVHVDLAERRNAYRLCQWDVRTPDNPVQVVNIEVPLPRMRPKYEDAHIKPIRAAEAGIARGTRGQQQCEKRANDHVEESTGASGLMFSLAPPSIAHSKCLY